MSAFADDVAIDETHDDYASGGGDLTINFLGGSGTADGVGLIVVAAVEATDGNRDVASVTLDSSIATDLSFIEIGRIDGDDAGPGDHDQRLTIWKLDNRAFIEASTDEGDYSQVIIDFDPDAIATYGFVYIVSGQMPDDLIRNWKEVAVNDSVVHNLDDVFILEPDAIIISAHMWESSGGNRNVAGSENEDWDQDNNTTGLLVQSAAPNVAAMEDVSVTFTWDGPGSGDPEANTLNAAVVIRSDEDIVHTPAHTPATLGNDTGSNGGYWLEGVIAKKNSSTAHRLAIEDYGVLHEEKATWLVGDIVQGDAEPGHLEISHEAEGELGTNQINIMNFSPLNPDREAEFDMYLAGLIDELGLALDTTNGTHRHLGANGADWGDYTGLVVWDLERFCLHYGGAKGHMDSTDWGGVNVFHVDGNIDPWDYNAAARYYWERVHQWFVEVYATNDSGATSVEACIFYHHPQQPTAPKGLNSNWWSGGYANAGYDWQQDIEWVFTMQGAFDGHVYPMVALADSEVDDWVTNVLENYRVISEHLNDMYCYITHWPGHAGREAYQPATVVGTIIQTDDAIRTRMTDPWTNFDAMYLGVVGLGQAWEDTFPISAVDGPALTVTIAGEVANEFDPMDPNVDIQGSTSNNGTYNFASVAHGGGNTIVSVSSGTLETVKQRTAT